MDIDDMLDKESLGRDELKKSAVCVEDVFKGILPQDSHATAEQHQDTKDRRRYPKVSNAMNLSFGEKLVGMTVDDTVDEGGVAKAKRLCAELANLVEREHRKGYNSGVRTSELQDQIRNHAIGEILNASLCAVRSIEFREG